MSGSSINTRRSGATPRRMRGPPPEGSGSVSWSRSCRSVARGSASRGCAESVGRFSAIQFSRASSYSTSVTMAPRCCAGSLHSRSHSRLILEPSRSGAPVLRRAIIDGPLEQALIHVVMNQPPAEVAQGALGKGRLSRPEPVPANCRCAENGNVTRPDRPTRGKIALRRRELGAVLVLATQPSRWHPRDDRVPPLALPWLASPAATCFDADDARGARRSICSLCRAPTADRSRRLARSHHETAALGHG
jgi:hypothetical protein